MCCIVLYHLGYKCKSDESLDVDTDVQIELTNVQYRAFGETDEDNFPDDGGI